MARAALNRITALLDKLEPEVRDAFLAAVFAQRGAVDLEALEAALRAGDVARAVGLLTAPQALLYPLDAALMGGYAAGAGMVVDSARRSGVIIGFDGRHPRAEAFARNHVGGLITDILASQREGVTAAVRDVIERQLVAGVAPRTAALDIVGRVDRATGRRVGGLVGLDAPRAERLRIVGDAMRTPDGVRSLIEGGRVRYKVNQATADRILRAYNQGRAVSEADRVLSLRQYGNQLLRERGETIARTESITALRAGRREGFEQAIENGTIARDAVTREWDATMDSRTRPDHQAMDGKTIQGLETAWVLPDGSRMMYPGDTSLGAPGEQTIQCRCYEAFRVDWLRGANG